MNTKEMIEVMKAFEDGKKIEVRDKWFPSSWDSATTPTWNWYEREYRIAPEPKKAEGRWERVQVVRNASTDYAIMIGTCGGMITLDILLRVPGFGGIEYRSPFDEKRIVQSMVPVMFDPFGGAMTAGFSGINTSCRPGIPVAAWFWREGEGK
jgi:hypothetical protein